MKKLIAALAVLTIAAVAQADLLASWNFTGSNSTDWSLPMAGTTGDNVASASLSAGGNWTASTGANSLRANGAGWGTAEASASKADYLQVDLKAENGYEMTVNEIVQLNVGSGTGRGGTAMWVASANGGSSAAFGSSWTTANTSSQTTTGEITGSQIQLRLIATLTATGGSWGFNGGSTANPSLQIKGSTAEATSVPEPATMSLLGLGALAMVLRRKLRK